MIHLALLIVAIWLVVEFGKSLFRYVVIGAIAFLLWSYRYELESAAHAHRQFTVQVHRRVI